MIGLSLICSACAGRADLSHACRHGRRFLTALADAVSVQAAYAFGDWPPPGLIYDSPTRVAMLPAEPCTCPDCTGEPCTCPNCDPDR